MKYLKMLGLVALAATALTAFGASSASATTLSITGVKQSGAVTLTASLEAGTKAKLSLTDGSLANECATSDVHGTTTSFTGTKIGGPISTLTFESCVREKVEVIKAGSLDVEWIKGTHNGTVFSTGAEVKVPSAIGTLTCTTPAAGTDIGTLTGSTTGMGTMDIKATLNCGFLAPSANWAGSYVITSPHSLAVVE